MNSTMGPQQHPPYGPQTLLDNIFPHHILPSDKQDSAVDSNDEDLLDTSLVTSVTLALDSVTDVLEHTITANAAQLLTNADQE